MNLHAGQAIQFLIGSSQKAGLNHCALIIYGWTFRNFSTRAADPGSGGWCSRLNPTSGRQESGMTAGKVQFAGTEPGTVRAASP